MKNNAIGIIPGEGIMIMWKMSYFILDYTHDEGELLDILQNFTSDFCPEEFRCAVMNEFNVDISTLDKVLKELDINYRIIKESDVLRYFRIDTNLKEKNCIKNRNAIACRVLESRVEFEYTNTALVTIYEKNNRWKSHS
jgi:hypothetical protein